MPMFLGVHDMGGSVEDEAVRASWEAYKTACQAAGCKPTHAHYNAQNGKAYCLTEADSADQVQKAHNDAQVPVNEVFEVKDLQ